MEKITAIRGFKDILPEDSDTFWKVETIARNIFKSFGFREIRVPIMEKQNFSSEVLAKQPISLKKKCILFPTGVMII